MWKVWTGVSRGIDFDLKEINVLCFSARLSTPATATRRETTTLPCWNWRSASTSPWFRSSPRPASRPRTARKMWMLCCLAGSPRNGHSAQETRTTLLTCCRGLVRLYKIPKSSFGISNFLSRRWSGQNRVTTVHSCTERHVHLVAPVSVRMLWASLTLVRYKRKINILSTW